jgi:uncharacterized membrane protein
VKSVDDIGDATVKFLSRLFYYVIGFLIWLIKTARPLGKKIGENAGFYSYFENRNIEFKDYVVLKVQVATLVFLAASVSFVFGFLGLRVLGIFAVFGVYSLYLTHAQLKEHFRDDYHAYRAFFVSYFAISVLLVFVRFVKPTVNFVFPYFHLLAISAVSVVGASYLFKRKYGRNYTFGRVTKGGDFMSVKVNYDLLSSVKPGVHTFENRSEAKEGDIVKLMVEASGLNIGGSRVVGQMVEEKEEP